MAKFLNKHNLTKTDLTSGKKLGLPRWLSGKESACQCRRCGFSGSYIQIWVMCGFGRTDAEAEAPVLWPPDAKSQLTGKEA